MPGYIIETLDHWEDWADESITPWLGYRKEYRKKGKPVVSFDARRLPRKRYD